MAKGILRFGSVVAANVLLLATCAPGQGQNPQSTRTTTTSASRPACIAAYRSQHRRLNSVDDNSEGMMLGTSNGRKRLRMPDSRLRRCNGDARLSDKPISEALLAILAAFSIATSPGN